jgi:hypothetical protein
MEVIMGTMEDLQMAKSMAQGSLSNDKMMIYITQKKSEALLGVCSFYVITELDKNS